MKKQEGITWILDRPHTEIVELKQKYPNHDEYMKHLIAYDTDKYAKNIEFVHSLGLKCDSVGWSYLDFGRPDTGEILTKIEKFCNDENWYARGVYSCNYTDFESDWYKIAAKDIDTVSHCEGNTCAPYAIEAYKYPPKHLLLGWHNIIPALVSERFRQVCTDNNVPDADFCRAKDVGKYDAPPRFFMYLKNRVSTIACGNGLRYSDEYFPYFNRADGTTVYKHREEYCKDHSKTSPLYERLQKLGGYLPRLAEVFNNLTVFLCDHYKADEFPESGFAYIQGERDFNKQALLVHKDTAELLIREKLLDRSQLHPIMTYTADIPEGYTEAVYNNRAYPPFDPEYAEKAEEEYRLTAHIKRPQRKTTDNMALKLLRMAKRDNKESYGKRMKKELSEQLTGTAYEALIPYYLTADGGDLGGEYSFLDYNSAAESTAEFKEAMSKEELTEEIPHGTVFAKCADGDAVILTPTGEVKRITHGYPEVNETWPTLAQFFTEALENI